MSVPIKIQRFALSVLCIKAFFDLASIQLIKLSHRGA